MESSQSRTFLYWGKQRNTDVGNPRACLSDFFIREAIDSLEKVTRTCLITQPIASYYFADHPESLKPTSDQGSVRIVKIIYLNKKKTYEATWN